MAYKLEPYLVIFDYLEFTLSLILRMVFDFIFLCTSPIWYFIEAFQSATKGHKIFNTVLITGASSGIGQACAIEFAQRNPKITLFLLARDEEKLNETKRLCLQYINNQESVHCYCVDNTNKKEVERIINECDEKAEIDLFFANAGISNMRTNSADWFERYEQIINTNIIGTFNCVFPIMKRFIKRKRGHIAFNASVACYNILLGSTSVFSATKVFIKFMCQTISISLMYYNIDCTVINLGYVDTNSIYSGVKKFAKSKENTASVIVNGLYRNKSSIHYPFHFSFLMWYIGSLHPVLNSCINWISMPGEEEPNHVFNKYLNDGNKEEEPNVPYQDDYKETKPFMSDEDK
eukprot:252757_1